MSNNKNRRLSRSYHGREPVSADPLTESAESFVTANRRHKSVVAITGQPPSSAKPGRLSYLKTHWRAVLLVCVLSIGAFGAALKYVEEDARRQMLAEQVSRSSLLNSVNPVLPNPSPSPTPQLAKEYIYAGSRLLAVEDANASAAPPIDLAVWRPSNGVWWVMGAGGAAQAAVQFGGGVYGDTPHPGDYDGDGKTDFCVYRSSQNETAWYVLPSSTNVYYGVAFGSHAAQDHPVPADYDGDGKTDLAVYRPGEGKWYINKSSDQTVMYVVWGMNLQTDQTAAADYDGDGRADIAVWRKGEKSFFVLSSASNYAPSQITFNDPPLSTAMADVSEPVSSDYDGDGKADFAVRSGASWIIRQSSTNQTVTVNYGWGTDEAVPNDYDGDGKTDVAVWRGVAPSNPSLIGDWYILQSASGQTRIAKWGVAGDKPVPVFYRR